MSQKIRVDSICRYPLLFSAFFNLISKNGKMETCNVNQSTALSRLGLVGIPTLQNQQQADKPANKPFNKPAIE
jgi:hypothetical protein